MKLSRYCACGSALIGTVVPDSAAQFLADAWDKTHNEPGCKPATPEQARAARRRNERASGRHTDGTPTNRRTSSTKIGRLWDT